MTNLAQKQFLKSLRLNLFSRSLHPELFEIRDSLVIDNGNFEAVIWLTRCAHVVGFYTKSSALSEAIADDSVPLPSRKNILSVPIRGEKTHEFHNIEDIRYMMGFQVEAMTPRTYQAAHRDIKRRAEKTGMLVEFPAESSNDLTAFTYLSHEILPKGLHIMSFHALSGISTFVKTQSIFEIV